MAMGCADRYSLQEMFENNHPTIWVFGYGSLLWKPDFEYASKRVGYISGFVRRFWQGNSTHRGTPGQPGRVAHLVESRQGCTWGVAYEIKGQEHVQKVLAYLDLRETKLGGYMTLVTEFEPRDHRSKPWMVLVFTVNQENTYYLGEADVPRMAAEIVAARGNAGTNVEYVTRIADYVRYYIPEDNDEHLFSLDCSIRKLVREMIGSNEDTEWYYDMHQHNLLTEDLVLKS